MKHYKNNEPYGVLFIMIHSAAVSGVFSFFKLLRQDGLQAVEVTFLYKTLLFICILPWVLREGKNLFTTKYLKFHIARGILTAFATICLSHGIETLGLADATSLGYLEQILWLLIGAIYFKEKINKLKASMILLSLVGAILVIFTPTIEVSDESNSFFFSIEKFNIGYIFVILSAVAWSINTTIIKKISRKEKQKTQMFYIMLSACIFSGLCYFITWSPINSEYGCISFLLKKPVDYNFVLPEFTGYQLGIILLIGVLYFIHSVSFFQASRMADLLTLLPFTYSRLFFSAIFGYILFDENIDNYFSILGYTIIICSNICIAISERRKKVQEKLQENFATTESENI